MIPRFAIAVVCLVFAVGCDDPTGELPPITWTPSLELAAESLSDPLAREVVDGLPDAPSAGQVRALVLEADALARARDVAAAAERITEARDILAGEVDWRDAVHPAVLELILRDAEERFRAALAAAST